MPTCKKAFAADSHKVTARIEHGGSVVGEPTLLVKAGVPASVGVRATIAPQEQDEVEVSVKANTRHGSVSSVVTTKTGRPIIVASGEVGLSLTVDRDGS
jgi:hypothetical protein